MSSSTLFRTVPKTPAVTRAGSAFLAVSATGISACLSVIAAWERGGQDAERFVWVGLSLVLLLAAHLLPALSRSVSVSLRAPAAVLWLAAMVATGYGHVTFFLMAQHHAGEVRAAAIEAPRSTLPAPVGRDPGTIAAQRAAITGQIAALDATPCPTICRAREARRTALYARRDALNVEYTEAMRREHEADRFEDQQDKYAAAKAGAMSDPVTTTLAQLAGTTAARVDLIVGLAFGAVLESVACFAWLLALPAASHEVVTASHEAPVTSHVTTETAAQLVSASIEPVPEVTPEPEWSVIPEQESDTVRVLVETSVSHELADLVRAIKAGACRATVASIREFKECSQDKARELRRQLGEVMPEHAGRLRSVA